MKRLIIMGAAALAVFAIVGGADATPSGPVLQVQNGSTFQAPLGAVSFTTSGDIGRAGGLTWTYSGIDSSLLSQFASLEWGPANSTSVKLAMDDGTFANPNDVLSFDAADSDLANGVAVWEGGPISFLTGNTGTRLTVAVTDLSNTPIAFQTTSGYGDGATVPITGNFKAHLELDIGGGSSWSPYLDAFDSTQPATLQSGHEMFDDVTAGFFYTAASTGPAVQMSGFDFGSQAIGSNTTHTVTVKNTGGQALNITNVATTGDYSVANENCTSGPVAFNSTCTVTVQFTPSQTGSRPGTLVLTDNAADTPQSVDLNGTGVAIPIGPVLQVVNGTTFQSPLGAVSFAPSGDIGRPGGLTWTYSGITSSLLSQFGSLEWGPGDGKSVELSVNDSSFANPADVLTFDAADSDLAHGKAVWMGGPISFLTINPQTRLTIQVTDLSNNPIPFHTTNGYADGATAPLSGNFKANLEMDVGGGSSWTPYKNSFDAIEQGNQLSNNTAYISVTAGLFYTASASAPAVSMQGFDWGPQRIGTHQTHDVTVTNTGNAPLHVTNVATSGDPSFSVNAETCTSSSPIAPNGTCTVTVQWVPAVDGQVQGSLVLADDAPNSPQSVHLNGFGIHSAVSFTLPPNSFNFGIQTINTTSGVSTATIQNTGTTDLNVGQLTVSGNFALVNDTCSNQDIGNGLTCSFGVTFTPTQDGPLTGTVTVPSDAQSSPDTVALSGTGIEPQPFLGLPSSVAFGSQGLGRPVAKTFTVTNTGSADLHVSSTSAGGDYSVSTDTCTGASVAPNATCTIGVTFTPSVKGTDNGTLTIASDAASSPDHVPLTGTGIDAHFLLTPNPMDFGDVYTTQSKTLTLTFSNPGTDPASLLGPPSVTGPNSGDFKLNFNTFTCPQSPGPSVPAQGSCTLTITFTPSGSGTRTASLTFPNNSSDGPATLVLTGNGIDPVLSASPSSLTFDPQPLGTPSASKNVTITNTGSTPLTISSISSGGDFTADASDCSSGVVTPTHSCVVKITFTPGGTGPRSSTLTITSNALSSPDSVPLSGTGIDPKLSGPASTDFGSLLIGHSTTKTITISSTGTTALSVQSVTIGGNGYSILTDGCSLQSVAPGGSCSVTVQFAPTVGGASVGTLTVKSNAPSSPDQLGLTGTGLAGTFAASPASVDFGSVVDGKTAEKTVTVSNSGTGPLVFSSIGFTGSGKSVYSIDPIGTTCTSSTVLPSGGSCSVVIAISPVVDGTYNASLEVNGDGTNAPFDVPLTGSGVSPKISVNPIGLVFGIQPVIGHLTANAATQTITVTDTGTSALTISGIVVTGPFVLVGDGCTHLGPLPSGISCLVQVAFVPTVAGLAYGTLTFTSDAGPLTMSLSGTGIDTTPPVLHGVPSNLTVGATGPGGATVSYTAPTATDDADPSPTVVCTPASGTVFALGTTTVTCSAKDASGNTSSATFTVTVKDTTPPAFTGVPGPITVPATGKSGAVVTYTAPTAKDLVDGTVAVTCSPSSGKTFAIGTTTVTCKASDSHGNTASASFTVTVLGPVPMIQALQAQVNGLPELQGNRDPAKSLRTKLSSDLQNALNELTERRPDLGSACRAMDAFIHDASDPRNVAPRGPLTVADSAALVASAKRIEGATGC